MAYKLSAYSDQRSVDKGWAWMVLLGANMWNVTVSGTLKSFGVLYVELMVMFNSGPAETGWVGFVFSTMMVVFSPFAGYLGDKVSSRWILIIGGVVAASGVFFTGFAPSLPWAIVTYGVISGSAVGIMDGPVFSTLNKYFHKRRAFANSMAFTGSGVGCLVMPLLIRICVEYYTIRGTMFILGGLWLHSLVIGALFRPIRLDSLEVAVTAVSIDQKTELQELQQNSDNLPPQEVKDGAIVLEHNTGKHDDCLDEKLCAKTNMANHDPLSDVVKVSATEEIRTENGFQVKGESSDRNMGTIESSEATRSKSNFFSVVRHALNDYWQFLNNMTMLRIVLAIMFGSIAYFSQIFLFPPLAEELGISKLRGALLVSLTGIAEMTSRIPLGLLCDKPFMNKPLVVSVLSLVSCAIALLMSFVPLWEVLVAYACVIGVLGGTAIPLAMPMLADVVPTAKIGSAAGLFLWAMGMAFAVAPPILGAVKEYSGLYMHSFRLSALMYIPTALFLLWGIIVQHLQRRNSSDSTKSQSKSQV